MADGELRATLADWLSRVGLSEIGPRRGFWRGVPREANAVHTTRGFPLFLEYLRTIDRPLLVDFGPAIGANVDFFGRQLSCKVQIEDVFADLDHLTHDQRTAELPQWFVSRFEQADASVDGVLCWDLCDYLDATSVEVLARQMARMLKPGGVALTMFGTEPLAASVYTKYVVVDVEHFQHRWYAAAKPPGDVWLMGRVLKLFGGLEPVGSHLLVHQQREVLFRKPL